MTETYAFVPELTNVLQYEHTICALPSSLSTAPEGMSPLEGD